MSPLSPKIMNEEIIEGYRLSPQQERLWLLQRSGGGAMPSLAQCVILIDGRLEIEALRVGLIRVIERHEILRTSFHCLPGMSLPVQVIANPSEPKLVEQDLSALDGPAQTAALAALLAAAQRAQLDSGSAPLSQFLVKLATDRHALLINVSALCADRLGLDNLAREISRSYEACVRNAEQTDEPLQYVDLAEWQNEVLESADTEAGQDFWRQRDYSSLHLMHLPSERQPRLTSDTTAMMAEPPFMPLANRAHLDNETTNLINSAVALQQTTLPAFLLACWQTLLWRLSGEPAMTIGVSYPGRNHPGLPETLGLFVKHLPIQTQLESDVPISQHVARVEATLAEAGKWQDYFIWQHIASAMDEPLTGTDFFDFCFEYAEQLAPHTVGDVSFLCAEQYVCAERFKVKLLCLETAGALSVEFHYDAAQFEPAAVQRLWQQFSCLLRSAASAPGTSLSRLNILSADEQRQVLHDFNDTATDYGPSVCLHQLFEAQAERTPAAVAVCYEDEQLTYDELNRRANQLAHYLRGLGVGPEALVGICVERSLEMVVGLLGILKAGGAYVPLDPGYPAERLSFMLEDAAVAVLLTQEHLRPRLLDQRARVICLDTGWVDIARDSSANPGVGVTPEQLAYMIYTSGSTGRPKGVLVTHRSIVNRLLWMQHAYPLTPADRVLQKTAFSFDASIWELFVPLFCGAQLVLARPGGQQDSRYLVEMVQQHRITTLQLVPTMLQVWLGETGVDQCQSLRRMWCGGEAVTHDLQRRFYAAGLAAELHNLYGPTEAAIDATHWVCEPGEERAVVPIGRPLANMQIYILDATMEAVPVGVAGELYIGGVQLARGYWRRPELTADRFVPHPYSAQPGARLYRSGDLARYAADGTLEFLGRIDQQVKLRGYRIELGEIEAALTDHEGVREAVVVMREDEPGHKRLVAYVVPRQDGGQNGTAQSLYELPNGLEVTHLNRNETQVIYQEIFEDLTYLRHGVVLDDGACVFDVGANIGLFTLFVHHVSRGAQVFAFEPVPATFEKLKHNVDLYGLDVKLFDCGISDQTTTAQFTFYPKMSAMSGLYPDLAGDEEVARAFMRNQDESLVQYADELLAGRFDRETFVCQLRTISEVIFEHNVERIDLLKVDVEKSELNVLRGIEENDWAKIRQIAIEVHDVEGRLAEISDLLEKRGYDLVVEQDALLKSTAIYNLYATRRAPTAAQSRQRHLTRPLAPLRRHKLTADKLRNSLKEKLPEYMVPSAFVMLKALPRTPNGKLDRRALPLPDGNRPESDDSYVPPRTSAEVVLAGIWEQLLGVERVGIHDNFFSLGGDSILSIQIIARANQAGLRLTPTQLFAHQTIAELAAVAGSVQLRTAEQGLVTGDIPLTPAQHWFFTLDIPDRHHWNQAVLLEAREHLDVALLHEVVQQLFVHHDALRLRFTPAGVDWRQSNAGPDEIVPFSVFDLSELSVAEHPAAIEAKGVELQTSLNISAGPLARVAYFELGADRPGRLLFVVHHLAVDGISWRILLEDLQGGYQQLKSGAKIEFAPKTTSFKDWARRLTEYAQSAELRTELTYWLDESRRQAKSLPADYRSETNTRESARSVTVELDAEETAELLKKVPQAYSTQIAEVLLAAVSQAFSEWTGHPALLIDMEGHGREEIITEVDLSRTVGWFTTLFPVLLELKSEATPGDALLSVKEQLRSIPHRGIGYGLLRYLAADMTIRGQLSSLPQAQVSFNYLGQFDQVLTGTSLLTLARESAGQGSAPQAGRSHLLEISGGVVGGKLHMAWTYSEQSHHRSTIEALAESFIRALRALIAHCSALGARVYSPSDFPLARIDQEQLHRLSAGGQEIEDIYPLSPLQEGMLFHTIYSPETDVYVEQLNCTLHGALDVAAFVQAWQRVLDRYSILRTAFVWENLEAPLQIVRRQVRLPLTQHDWRDVSPAEQQERLQAYQKTDRRRGFEPAQAPLMRLTLVRLAADVTRCMWNFHHLLLDGWCVSLLLKEVFAYYEAFSRGQELQLEQSRPFRDYLVWLQRQSLAGAEIFWRETLRGFIAPTPLGGRSPGADSLNEQDDEHHKQQIKLSTTATSALQSFAQRHQLTMNTLVQGAWALVLSRHSGAEDVVFGTVVSGRPAELRGVETMVGSFINTLPVRVRVAPEAPLLSWLSDLQTQQAAARQYEQTPLVQVKNWSDAPRALPLFESLLTFENRPVDLNSPGHRLSIEIREVNHFNRNHFPLTIVANPFGQLTLQASYDPRRFEVAIIMRLLSHLQTTLENMITQPDAKLSEIEVRPEAEMQSQADAQRQREEAKLQRFRSIKPKAVGLSSGGLVKQDYLRPGELLPLVLQPTVSDLDASNWAQNNRAFIEGKLVEHGAILFRNFGLRSVAEFEQFAQAIYPDLFSNYGDLPREETSSKIYKSTPYPADKAILFHNESSHLRQWPLKQWFFCVTAAQQGGETPIVDCRKIFRMLDPRITEPFAEKQLMYVRNFIDGFDVSWQEFFKTDDRAIVEDRCREASIDFVWKDTGLSTRQVCQAVARHPRTGETVFFNQVQLHHVSSLEPEARRSLQSLFREDDYPRNVYYGDGSPIEDSVIKEICELYRQQSVSFPWQEGDVLMLDNMLTAHARNPFAGPRKIVVAMGEMIAQEDI